MKIESLGEVGAGGWKMVTDGLDAKSVVYSFGVGDNIQWDLEMIKRFGCKVYAFDPDPLAAQWLAKQQLPPQFIFRPEGISIYDGTQRFYDAFKVGKINMSVVRKNKTFKELPVKRLQTFMRELGHDHIDVLNVDVEGLEYRLIGDIIRAKPRQLMIELHKGFFRLGWFKTWLAVMRLRLAGYKLLDVVSWDHLFWREQ